MKRRVGELVRIVHAVGLEVESGAPAAVVDGPRVFPELTEEIAGLSARLPRRKDG